MLTVILWSFIILFFVLLVLIVGGWLLFVSGRFDVQIADAFSEAAQELELEDHDET